MPHKNWAVGEEVIATDFNPIVADQVVAQFPNAANRASNWLDPPVGAVSHLGDSPGVLWIYTATAWVPYGARGFLGSAFNTADTSIPALSGIDYVSVTTPALPAGRRVKVTLDLQFGNSVSYPTTQAVGTISDVANEPLSVRFAHLGAGESFPMTLTWMVTPPAGAYTVKGRAGANTPGGDGLYIQEAFLLVEDIGGG